MGVLDFSDDGFREPGECVITVDGNEITDLYPFLTEVRVECTRTRWSQASLRFETGRDEYGKWAVQDEEILVPWKPVDQED